MKSHDALKLAELHSVIAKSWADIATRDADVAWISDSTNIGKIVETNAPQQIWIFTAPRPGEQFLEITNTQLRIFTTADRDTYWGTPPDGLLILNSSIGKLEYSEGGVWITPGSEADTLAEILLNGNETLGTSIIVTSGDVVTLTDDPADPTDAANKRYVDNSAAAHDALDEVLAIGNTSGPNDIIMQSGQVITVPDAPENGTDAVNADFVTTSLAAQDEFVELTDTPADYSGSAMFVVRVNPAGNALEFHDGAGSGDVVGPASSINNSVPTWDALTGRILKDSGKVSIDPVTGDVNIAGDIVFGPGGAAGGVISPRDDIGTVQITGSSTSGKGAYVTIDSAAKSGGILALTHGDYTAPALISEFLVRHASNGVITNQIEVNATGDVTLNAGALHLGTGAVATMFIPPELHFNNASLNWLSFKNNNWGIGSSDPQHKLEVIGDAYIDANLNVYNWVTVGETPIENLNASIAGSDTDRSFVLNNIATATRDGYATPLAGMLHNNSDLDVPEFYNGTRQKFEALKSSRVVYVHSVDDLPTPVAGQIVLEDYVRYIGDNAEVAINIVDDVVFGANSQLEDLKIITSKPFKTGSTDDFEIRDCVITYTGGATFLDMPDIANVSYFARSTINMAAAGTVFGIGSVTANTALIMENVIVVCNPAAPGNLGAIDDIIVNITSSRMIYFSQGLTFADNDAVGITTFLTVGANLSGTHLTFNGAGQNDIQISGFNPFIQNSEYAFDFDTGTVFAGVVTCLASTPNDHERVFAATSYDQTTVGFKFLGNANIPDSTAALHMNALNQAAVQTILDVGVVKRVFASFTNVDAERFTTTAWGNMQYLGGENIKFGVNAHITGTTSSGTNIPFNFYIAKNKGGLLITSFTDVSPGVVGVNTNIPHDYLTGDRIIQENSSYDGEFVIASVTASYYEIPATYVGTSSGFPSKVILDSKASNYFSNSADKIVGINSLIEMATGDIIFLCCENTSTGAEWNTSDIQAVLTKV